MAEVQYDKLVKLVKGDNEITQSAAAKALGVSTGQLSMLVFSQAKVDAGVYKKIPATAVSVKKARDIEGNRWELIAARTGQGVARVKALYEEAGGNAKASYTGKGRNFANGTGTGKKPASSGRQTGGKASAASNKAASSKSSGGRATGRSTGKPAGRTTGRRTTANPS